MYAAVLFLSCERLPVDPPDKDTLPPAIPSGVEIFYSADGEVGIVWDPNPEPDISYYEVHRMDDSAAGIYKRIGRTTGNYFIDDSLDYDLTYWYTVSAGDRAGNVSLPSDSVSARPKNIYAPLRPRNFEALASNNEGRLSMQLTWSPPYETDISGFVIYRGLTPDFIADTSFPHAFTGSTRFTDTAGLETGITYYYKIAAKDRGGLFSPLSNISSDVILPLPEIVYPPEGQMVPRFNLVRVTGIPFPCSYKLLLQHNQSSGELWNVSISHNGVSDTVYIPFQSYYISSNRDYYLRIETYYKSGSYPNGITFSRRFSVRN